MLCWHAPRRIAGISVDRYTLYSNVPGTDDGDMLNYFPPSTPCFTLDTISCPAEASSMNPCSV